MGYFGESQLEAYTWFKSFLLVEACVISLTLHLLLSMLKYKDSASFFQVPVFLIGLRGLWRGTSPYPIPCSPSNRTHVLAFRVNFYICPPPDICRLDNDDHSSLPRDYPLNTGLVRTRYRSLPQR